MPPPEEQKFRFPLIDGFQFAHAGQELRGRCPVSAFERLRDLLSSDVGDLAYEVIGGKDPMGRPALRMKVGGALRLACQRCLKEMSYPLKVDAELVLAQSEAEIEAHPVEPEGPDRVLGSKEMALGTMLEDEILLAVPFAPRHEQCSGDGAGKGETKASPFAHLRGLLDRGGGAGN